MGKKYDLVSLGILVFDVFGKEIEQFPEPGTSIFYDRMEVHPGGCAYNTGVDMAHLGGRTLLMGKVGEDSFGDMLLESAKREGVETGILRDRSAGTSFSFIMVSGSGERRIYTSFGANGTLSAEDINREAIRDAGILHIGGASMLTRLDGEQTLQLLRYARENGVRTSVDPVYRKNTKEILSPYFPHLDYFLPNTEESVHITGYTQPMDQLRYYLDAGVKTAGIKLGKRGCLIGSGGEVWKLGIYDMPVVDTCGAGDAFAAGFLYGITRGWETLRCARFASAVSAFCVSAMGATSAVPDAKTVESFMAERSLPVERLA